MNKKVLLACAIAFMVLVISFVSFLYIRKQRKERTVIDSEYPIVYTVKDDVIRLTLNGKRTKELSWTVDVENESFVSVTQKGEERNGKAKYILTPKAEGLTSVDFRRSTTIGGYDYDAVDISLPIYVAENQGKLVINFLEEPKVIMGPEVVAKDSEYPFLVGRNDQGQPELTFINGMSDWTITDPNEIVVANTSKDGNVVRAVITKKDENSNKGIIQETTLEVGSASMGITGTLDVVIDVDGIVTVTKSAD